MKNHLRYVKPLLLLLVLPWTAKTADIIRSIAVSVPAGSQCAVQIQVDNTDAFVAFQADIPIPAGLTYVNGSAQLNPSRITDHVLSSSLLGTTLRLIAYSPSNAAFSGSSGTLITFSLTAGTIPGGYTISLTNTLLGNNQSQPLTHTVQNGTVTVLGPNYQGSAGSLDFGRIALTSAGTQYVNVQNMGNQNLVISGITFTDAQFTSPQSNGFTLTPGQNLQVSVVFAPVIKGTYVKQMKILSNDPDTPQATITLNATGYAVNELHAGNMVAASGTTALLELTANNMEPFTGLQFDMILSSPMSFINGSAVLSRQQDHSVQAGMVNSNTLRVVAYSASGKNFIGNNGKIMSLGFQINGTGGSYPINIENVIIADAAGENVVSAWYDNTLQITAPDIYAVTSVNFGDVSVVSQGNQNLSVYNYGQENLKITQLNFNNAYFSSPQVLPVTVPPGNNQAIPLVFTKNIRGTETGKLQIINDDPDENPYVVNLSGNAFVPNYIVIGEHSVVQGDTLVLPVEIENIEPFVAFQFDLQLPDGLVLLSGEIQLTARKNDHVLAASLVENDKLRIIAYSPGQKTFTGTEGTVIHIPLAVPFDIAAGQYSLSISNSFLSNETSQNILYGVQNGTLNIILLTVPEQPGVISGNATPCAGHIETYSVLPVTGALSYTWSLPSGWTGTSTTHSITTTVGTSGGIISVTANNVRGPSIPRTRDIHVLGIPSQPDAISGNATPCQGTQETYSVATVTGATSYTWAIPSGWTGTSVTNSITATVGANGGTISVTANNACGSGTQRTQAVTVITIPGQPGAISGNATPCQGTQETYSIATVTGATSYTWTLPSGWTGTSVTNSITATIGATSGNISVTANNACGSGTPRTLSVTVLILPGQPGAISGNATPCQGTQETYSVATVTGATSYTWTLPSGWTGTSVTNSITATVGLTSGNISVTANNGCGPGMPQTMSVTDVGAIPHSAGEISGPSIVFTGQQNVLYSVPAIDGASSYYWTLPEGATGSSTTNTILVNFSINAVSGVITVKGVSVCGTGEESVISVSVNTQLQQTINFKSGWNLFSTFILPDTTDLKNIFQSMIIAGTLIKIQDESGNSLEDMGFFGGWTNNIGAISFTEGYKIKVNVDCQITVSGTPATMPLEIPLKAGWNIIGFPQQAEAEAKAVVQQLIDRGTLVKVQDEKGSSIEDYGMFGGWTNDIGNFRPGEGYKVKVTTNETLTIYESYLKSSVTPMYQPSPVFYKPLAVGNGVDHMNINLVDIPEGVLEEGDEIAVFDGDLCVGASVIGNQYSVFGNRYPVTGNRKSQITNQKFYPERSRWALITNPPIPVRNPQSAIRNKEAVRNPKSAIRNLSIPVTADDGYGEKGFKEGNSYTIKIWKSTTNQEYSAEPVILKGSSKFVKHESSLISLKNLTISGRWIFPNPSGEFNGIRIFPNPTTGKVNIHSTGEFPAGTVISVINGVGQEVLNRKLNTNPQVIDLAGNVNGMYYVRIISGISTKTEKIVLK